MPWPTPSGQRLHSRFRLESAPSSCPSRSICSLLGFGITVTCLPGAIMGDYPQREILLTGAGHAKTHRNLCPLISPEGPKSPEFRGKSRASLLNCLGCSDVQYHCSGPTEMVPLITQRTLCLSTWGHFYTSFICFLLKIFVECFYVWSTFLNSKLFCLISCILYKILCPLILQVFRLQCFSKGLCIQAKDCFDFLS